MITHPAYSVEPWCLRETSLDLSVLAQSESLFALSNGHLGWRGNVDEGDPNGIPGSYLNGVYESHPLPYAEAGYGYPEAGETVINISNGKVIRLLVDDQPFDVRYGRLISHERVLDFRDGLLRRSVDWISPAGKEIRVHSQRMVSLVERSIAAICYEVEAVNQPVRVVVQSELVANETMPHDDGTDPRTSADMLTPLVAEEHANNSTGAALLHRTARSRLRLGVAMEHTVDAPASMDLSSESTPDLGRVTIMATLQPGQRVRVVKFVAHGWSAVRSQPAVRDQVAAALAAAVELGWDGLIAEQHQHLDEFWDGADVQVDGDPPAQQAVRFALFHLQQAGACTEVRAIAAKGLTGPGYDGHAFWDTESFVLPVLTYTAPRAAADALRWRHSTLPTARARAQQLGLGGAVFPWRTIAGSECSGYWPAGTAAFHIGADIADAVVRYIDVTGDETFAAEVGLELLVHTARLWCSLGHYDPQRRFRIDGVTGPDEYSAVADNNVYTNLMAQHNLVCAADSAVRHPSEADALGVDTAEVGRWRDAAAAVVIPYDTALGVHAQSEGFTSHQIWDFPATAATQYPLLLHFPYFDLYRKQVVKQADLVLAMHLRGASFTAEEKSRNFAYYEALTVRDSSLSACTQSVLAAETGHMDLAYDYLTEAALMDLDDLEHNTKDGLHLAALAGTWIALVEGLAGLRERDGGIAFDPALPAGITRLAFTIRLRDRRLHVDVGRDSTRYRLREGPPLTARHRGQTIVVTAAAPTDMPNRLTRPLPSLDQPRGRSPRGRSRSGTT